MNTTSICALNLKQLNQTLDIATPAGGILPLLIGASRDPASHLLLLKVMKNYRQERDCNMSTHRRGGANNVMSPSSLFDITVMVQQIYLLTKAATLLSMQQSMNINPQTFSHLLTWVIDAKENSFLRTLGSSLNERNIQSKEASVERGGKEKQIYC